MLLDPHMKALANLLVGIAVREIKEPRRRDKRPGSDVPSEKGVEQYGECIKFRQASAARQ